MELLSAHSHSFPNPSRHQRKKPRPVQQSGLLGFCFAMGLVVGVPKRPATPTRKTNVHPPPVACCSSHATQQQKAATRRSLRMAVLARSESRGRLFTGHSSGAGELAGAGRTTCSSPCHSAQADHSKVPADPGSVRPSGLSPRIENIPPRLGRGGP